MSSPTEETPAAAADEAKDRKASQSSQGSDHATQRTRTISSGSGSGYEEKGPQRRQRSFSSSEVGRTIVIAVDASDDAKFAFECK